MSYSCQTECSVTANRCCAVRVCCLALVSAVSFCLGCGGNRLEGNLQDPETKTVVDHNGDPPHVAPITDITPEQAELSEERQKEVWDAEHATHLIEHRFGVRFKQALQNGSAADLASFLSEGATAEVIDLGESTTQLISSVTSETTNSDAKRSAADRRGLADWLLQVYAQPTAAAGVASKYSLRVLAISEGEHEATWLAKLLLTQTVGDSGAKRRIESNHHVAFRWDGVDDLEQSSPIRSWRVDSVRTSTAPAPLMVEVTQAAGLDKLPIQDNWQLPAGKKPQMVRFQMAVADYDRDGDLDIAVSSAGSNVLLRFDGVRFRPTNSSLGIHPTSRGQHVDISTSWIDYDNDGYQDLILGGRLYHNENGRRFTDVTARCGIEFHPHHMGCAVADYNADGHTDVYFIYAHDSKRNAKTNEAWIGDEQSGGRNQLWKNQGDGTFVDATAEAGVEGGMRQSFAANWLYADDDPHPDLYVANDFGTNSLFRNRGDGTFEDVSTASGTADFATSMGVASGDLDNDGKAEIYVANMYSKMGRRIVGLVKETDYPPGIYPRLRGACAGSRLYRFGDDMSQSCSEYSELAGVNKVGWAYAPTMADFNNDGLLDLYATCGFLSVDRSKPDG